MDDDWLAKIAKNGKPNFQASKALARKLDVKTTGE